MAAAAAGDCNGSKGRRVRLVTRGCASPAPEETSGRAAAVWAAGFKCTHGVERVRVYLLLARGSVLSITRSPRRQSCSPSRRTRAFRAPPRRVAPLPGASTCPSAVHTQPHKPAHARVEGAIGFGNRACVGDSGLGRGSTAVFAGRSHPFVAPAPSEGPRPNSTGEVMLRARLHGTLLRIALSGVRHLWLQMFL